MTDLTDSSPNPNENPEGLETKNIPQEPKKINPNSFIPVMEEMIKIFGDKFVDNKNEQIKELDDKIFSCTLLGVLFSAEWGSPCRLFNKDLIKIYEEVNEGDKVLEIIQVSFDRSEEDFKKSIAGLPWKFLAFDNGKTEELKAKYEELKKRFNVLTIPKFFPINKEGKILSETGREDLMKYGADIVEKWNEDARV